MEVKALYESVTNAVIKEMEAGAVPWVKPWETPRNHGSVMPHNLATGRPYSGINVPLLWGAADAKGYGGRRGYPTLSVPKYLPEPIFPSSSR